MVIVNLSELAGISRGMKMRIHFATIDKPLRGFVQEFGLLGVTKNRLALVNDSTITRSEEHTSELQSLMRISYAVFCLKQQPHLQIRNTEYNIRNYTNKHLYTDNLIT